MRAALLTLFALLLSSCCASECRGNSSAGHDYGTSLPEPDKDALLEFLKTYSAE